MSKFLSIKILIAIKSVIILLLTACSTEISEMPSSGSIEIPGIATIPQEVSNESKITTTTSHGFFIPFHDLALMASSATDVVRVEILDERTEMIGTWETRPDDIRDRIYIVNTVNRLKVLEVFYGDSEPGDIIEARQRGGQYGSENHINQNRLNLTIGDDYVLFLLDNCLENTRPPWLINHLGAYRTPAQLPYPQAILGASQARSISNNLVLQSVYSNNNLTLTVGDLANMAEGIMPQPTLYLLSFNLGHEASLDDIEPIYVPRFTNLLEYLVNNHSGFPLEGPTREGYVFMGWYLDTPTPVLVTEEIPMLGRNTTLYARWQHNPTPRPTPAPRCPYDSIYVTIEGAYSITITEQASGYPVILQGNGLYMLLTGGVQERVGDVIQNGSDVELRFDASDYIIDINFWDDGSDSRIEARNVPYMHISIIEVSAIWCCSLHDPSLYSFRLFISPDRLEWPPEGGAQLYSLAYSDGLTHMLPCSYWLHHRHMGRSN